VVEKHLAERVVLAVQLAAFQQEPAKMATLLLASEKMTTQD